MRFFVDSNQNVTQYFYWSYFSLSVCYMSMHLITVWLRSLFEVDYVAHASCSFLAGR